MLTHYSCVFTVKKVISRSEPLKGAYFHDQDSKQLNHIKIKNQFILTFIHQFEAYEQSIYYHDLKIRTPYQLPKVEIDSSTIYIKNQFCYYFSINLKLLNTIYYHDLNITKGRDRNGQG